MQEQLILLKAMMAIQRSQNNKLKIQLITLSKIQNFNNLSFFLEKDDYRTDEANNKGGKNCVDKAVVNKTRSVGKEVLKTIGKKLISGDFNLTKVSFPIKVMIPKTALETTVHSSNLK